MPAEILAAVVKFHSDYAFRWSLTMGDAYLMNTCARGSHHGDHYVHKQLLNQAFRSPEEIVVKQPPLSGDWVIPCGYSQSTSVGALLENAKA